MERRLWKIIVTSMIAISSIVLVIILTPTNESIRAEPIIIINLSKSTRL